MLAKPSTHVSPRNDETGGGKTTEEIPAGSPSPGSRFSINHETTASSSDPDAVIIEWQEGVAAGGTIRNAIASWRRRRDFTYPYRGLVQQLDPPSEFRVMKDAEGTGEELKSPQGPRASPEIIPPTRACAHN